MGYISGIEIDKFEIKTMKKLSLCIALTALTLVPALQAGEGCCPASKADNKDAKMTCPMSANKEKGACCAKAAQAQAKAKLSFDSSAKGATQLVKK